MNIIAAIDLNVETISAGILLLGNIFQLFKQKRTTEALTAVIDGVEVAAKLETNPKTQIKLATVGTIAGSIINAILRKKGYTKNAE
jgi:hypothetical protein